MLARLGTDYVEIGMIHYVDAEADLREVLDGRSCAWRNGSGRKGASATSA